MGKAKWILCPVGERKTRDKIREDTVLQNFPLYCPKCHKESIINLENWNITTTERPDAKPQSQ